MSMERESRQVKSQDRESQLRTPPARGVKIQIAEREQATSVIPLGVIRGGEGSNPS